MTSNTDLRQWGIEAPKPWTRRRGGRDSESETKKLIEYWPFHAHFLHLSPISFTWIELKGFDFKLWAETFFSWKITLNLFLFARAFLPLDGNNKLKLVWTSAAVANAPILSNAPIWILPRSLLYIFLHCRLTFLKYNLCQNSRFSVKIY